MSLFLLLLCVRVCACVCVCSMHEGAACCTVFARATILVCIAKWQISDVASRGLAQVHSGMATDACQLPSMANASSPYSFVLLFNSASTRAPIATEYNPIMVVPMIIFMSVTCFGLMNARRPGGRAEALTCFLAALLWPIPVSEALIGVIVERTTAAHQSMNEVQDEASEGSNEVRAGSS